MQPQAVRKPAIWIVDDSPTESNVAREALAQDYDVHVFQDGTAALEKLSAGPLPDLLVLDWVMPGLTGIEICQFLRSQPATAELPVLLLTVQQNTDQVVEGLGAGANDYLGKPYAAPELRARVGALIRSRTLRERADQAERVLRRVLTQLPDAVITIDGGQRVVFVNDEAVRLLGAGRQALVGRVLREAIPDIDLSSAAPGESGTRASLPDVRIRDLVLAPRVSIPPQDDEGNTTITLRDVTDARRKESRRLDFYSMVAHDLRSPLHAMQMRLQMIQQGIRGAVSPEIRGETDRMLSGVREMVSMINDFLDMAQIETGHFHIEQEPVDLRSVVGEAVEDCRLLSDARGLRIAEEKGPPEVVRGDARRLRQVVANLLSNAIKFTPRGGRVEVTTRSDRGVAEIAVRDTGPGIPEAAQKRLFRKYERVEGSVAGKVEGTGLGLVIVKEIVEAHGGAVGVRSTPGEGSTFWISLPRADAKRMA